MLPEDQKTCRVPDGASSIMQKGACAAEYSNESGKMSTVAYVCVDGSNVQNIAWYQTFLPQCH